MDKLNEFDDIGCFTEDEQAQILLDARKWVSVEPVLIEIQRLNTSFNGATFSATAESITELSRFHDKAWKLIEKLTAIMGKNDDRG